MKNQIRIIQAHTQQHYHTVPSELEQVTISPEREAIFDYLAQIGHARFPEFVIDVLCQVEGHNPVDITEGPGDEKQDILTILPSGERQLTQCKHSQNYKGKYSGGDLDTMLGACLRKNCVKGLLVTNTDLTPPAKRYITDKEYIRGWNGPAEMLPDIDYWNVDRLWRRVSTNAAILNKWFSGMGQTHGLRSFSFDLLFQRLPSGLDGSFKCSDIAKAIEANFPVDTFSNGEAYEFDLDSSVNITVRNWFTSDLDLGLHYVPPKTEHGLVNIPLSVLRFQVQVSNEVETYKATDCKDRIVSFIGERVLPSLSGGDWWYIVATAPKAFLYLHDIDEPKIIQLSNAGSYVLVGTSPVVPEKEWVFPQGEDYRRITSEGEDDLIWQHNSTGTQVTLIFEQEFHPVEAYLMQVRHWSLIKKLADYEFRAINNATQEIQELIRRVVDPSWIVMVSTDQTVYWAFPTSDDQRKVEKIEIILQRKNIEVVKLSVEGRKEVLRHLESGVKEVTGSYETSENNLVTPIWLNKRIFWLNRDVEIGKLNKEKLLELIKYKLAYEQHHGFDYMHGKKETRLASEEVQGLLFDLLTIRGRKMLDIMDTGGILSVHLRIKSTAINSTSELLPEYLDEMDAIVDQLTSLLSQ